MRNPERGGGREPNPPVAPPIYREAEVKINQHGDHEAMCLCCENFSLSYDQGWSEYTPGEGPQLSCDAGCFSNTSDMAFVHDMARTCPKFTPRRLS